MPRGSLGHSRTGSTPQPLGAHRASGFDNVWQRRRSHEGVLFKRAHDEYMSRFEELKRLDIRSRNQVRAILSSPNEAAVSQLLRLRGALGRSQALALEQVLASPASSRATPARAAFPKNPPFTEILSPNKTPGLPAVLTQVERLAKQNDSRLKAQIRSLLSIDVALSATRQEDAAAQVLQHIQQFGWSHVVLRKLLLVRELMADSVDEVEGLVWAAGLHNNNVVVTSLIHCFAEEQNYLTTKRSVLNLPERGTLNRYTRSLARITFQPFASSETDLATFIFDVARCSLIDAVIVAKFNSHLVEAKEHPALVDLFSELGSREVFDKLLDLYDPANSESEYTFYKQSAAWLEYEAIRSYRALPDQYYDLGQEPAAVPEGIASLIAAWADVLDPAALVTRERISKHSWAKLAALEKSGPVTRSALFNLWLVDTEGQVGLQREELLSLMGLTRDLSKTVPIKPVRTAAKLASDRTVKLILLLLLGKRSRNERDSFSLRRLLEDVTFFEYGGSLVDMLEDYSERHPDVAEYIYDITTEDFLAKLNRIAPHLADIPETRAKLHEWKARHGGGDFYNERARTVRIDHQLNRVRNEIDDNRIYVDPSRFSSWINDEVMVELNGALTTSGGNKKLSTVSFDEPLINSLMQQCYAAFCSNGIFGIASYIGRRIRHGTFRGQLYSGLINNLEATDKFHPLWSDTAFLQRWLRWKEKYDASINEIITQRLHVKGKQKPLGLFDPDHYSPAKQDTLTAATAALIERYTETKSTDDLDVLITEFCWRLAELDLRGVTSYLKSQQAVIKHTRLLDDLVACSALHNRKLAADFKRELVIAIDNRLTAMLGWFKKPSTVSPKASLALLFDAVVAEVRDTFPDFNPQTQTSANGDLELFGHAYHVLYDSFYVVIFNAAKYGDSSKPLRRSFVASGEMGERRIHVEIASAIRPEDSAATVSQMINERKAVQVDEANLYERRSGIPKLMLLMKTRKDFNVEFLDVLGREVVVKLSHALAH
jgi:hypothetical protein